MKANRHITAIITVLFIGFSTLNAQAYTAKTRDERYTTRYNQTASRPALANKRPVSMSTNHNPKSNYGGNHSKSHMHHYNVLYYPSYHEIYWNRSMYNNYHKWYPNYHWNYNYGHRIYTISVFDAKYNMGELAMVYGRIYASWHNKETDDYLLFFGGNYPAQQFTVVLPGRIARKFNWRPERYFPGEHMTITGLITTFDGIPEIIVKNRSQLGIY